jgi:hypothetical protein
MRDIRTDLRERLASVAGRYSDEIAEYNRKLEALEKSHKETLTALARERAALQHVPTAMNRDSQDTPEVRV